MIYELGIALHKKSNIYKKYIITKTITDYMAVTFIEDYYKIKCKLKKPLKDYLLIDHENKTTSLTEKEFKKDYEQIVYQTLNDYSD